jgi:hypothetical protein
MSSSSTSVTVAAAVAAVVLLAALAPAATAVPNARLAVSDVTVSPGTPVTGAPVTVDVTVSNGAGSPDALVVDEVRLVDDGDVVARSGNPGSLSPGGTLAVPLTARFSTAGVHDLTIQVRGRDENDERVEVRRPLSLVVEQAPPLVDVDAVELVAGSETLTPVVVSNPTTDAMRNVVVSLSTDNGEAVVARRTVPTLPAGASQPLNFSVRAASAGDATLSVNVQYTTGSGTRANETYGHAVAVATLDDDVGVRIDTAPPPDTQQQQPGGQLGALLGGTGGGDTTRDDGGDDDPSRVTVTVTNFGNAPVSNVVATPRVGETTLARVGVPGPLAPGATETVTVSLERVPAGALVVDVAYDVGSRSSTATGRFDFRPRTGAVRLTGIDLVRDDDGLVRLTGNAGNVGRGSVTGLVVAVGSAPGVEPAYPQRDYFVGTVEGSEFAPFELTLRTDANASTVPVVVSYAVDGDVREERVELPLDGVEQPESNRDPPLSLWLGVAGVVAVAVAAAVVSRAR